jgi:hypothetical protein
VALVRLAEKIDRMLLVDSLPTAEETARLASTPECEYVGFHARDLEKMWEELRTVKQEAERVFR